MGEALWCKGTLIYVTSNRSNEKGTSKQSSCNGMQYKTSQTE